MLLVLRNYTEKGWLISREYVCLSIMRKTELGIEVSYGAGGKKKKSNGYLSPSHTLSSSSFSPSVSHYSLLIRSQV